jgi:hypothetical protein
MNNVLSKCHHTDTSHKQFANGAKGNCPEEDGRKNMMILKFKRDT